MSKSKKLSFLNLPTSKGDGLLLTKLTTGDLGEAEPASHSTIPLPT
ncbi:hypothetical protein [Microcoleus anatoxicus]